MDCHISDQLFHPKQNTINICLKVSEKYQLTDYLWGQISRKKKTQGGEPLFLVCISSSCIPSPDGQKRNPPSCSGWEICIILASSLRVFTQWISKLCWLSLLNLSALSAPSSLSPTSLQPRRRQHYFKHPWVFKCSTLVGLLASRLSSTSCQNHFIKMQI